MGTASKPPGKAMYVAPKPDWDWLRIEQRKLYARSEQQVDYVFCKLWGLVTDPRNLRMALARVAGNRGRRTAGVDGVDPTGWLRPAGLSSRSIRESRVHNERCMPGSEGGARKPTGESRHGAARPPNATSLLSSHSSQRSRAKPRQSRPHSKYPSSSLRACLGNRTLTAPSSIAP